MEKLELAKTFKDKIGEPFAVYVVLADMCGLLRKYTCLITPYTFWGIKIPNAYRIKLYHADEDYYFELYNKVHFEYTSSLESTLLLLKGDGSDVRYPHGSFKYVFLDKRHAIEQAKGENNSAENDVEQARCTLHRFQIDEKEGSINMEINDTIYTVHLGKKSFVVEGVPGTFSYGDCKAYGVVVEYKMRELIKKRLEEHESDKL